MSEMSRRGALKLLAGQMALLAAGCSKPREEIVPYVRMPERMVPGIPLQFATTLELGGYGRGVVCTSFEGRPIKIEGNPLHPASLGATDVFAEAAIFSLYDPDRSQSVHQSGEISNWAAFLDALQPLLGDFAAAGGSGLRLLTGPVASPTLTRQIKALRRRFPQLVWHSHDPLDDQAAREGATMAFGRPITALPRLADADVVVSLDADPRPGPAADRQRARVRCPPPGAEGRRRLRPAIRRGIRPRLHRPNADHRLALPPNEIADVAIAVARARAPACPTGSGQGCGGLCGRLARDFWCTKGRAIVLAGPTSIATFTCSATGSMCSCRLLSTISKPTAAAQPSLRWRISFAIARAGKVENALRFGLQSRL